MTTRVKTKLFDRYMYVSNRLYVMRFLLLCRSEKQELRVIKDGRSVCALYAVFWTHIELALQSSDGSALNCPAGICPALILCDFQQLSSLKKRSE